MPVEVVHFNPRRRRPGLLGRVLPKRPLDNFGDLIGPALVERIVAERGLQQPAETTRLVTVGSIMRLTQPGDVIWGSGVNGKSMDTGASPALDIRAVRGPHTRAMLLETGAHVPEVYGDPALLWPRYFPRESYLDGGDLRAITVVPNLNDRASVAGPNVVSPLGDLHDIVRRIAQSEFVCGSSLHGIVIAEAFGIPARLIRSGVEPSFKYDDYYAGTGRASYSVAATVDEAVAMGGESPPVFDSDALLAAFPADIYAREKGSRAR